jgi:predicted nucleotidyltransferase
MAGVAGSREEVIARLASAEAEIRGLGVRRLSLFGSYGRGEAAQGSDVDVLVEFDPGRKTYDRFLRVSELLEQLLGCPVDVVTTEALSPYIGPHILAEAVDVIRTA